MVNYFIIRYFVPIALMIGWVLFQLLINKKKWSAIQGDAMTCLVFAAVWILIAYWMTK